MHLGLAPSGLPVRLRPCVEGPGSAGRARPTARGFGGDSESPRHILAELKKAGVDAQQQIFIAKTPLGETSMANVIGTIPGRRAERLAIASHFDTKRAATSASSARATAARHRGAPGTRPRAEGRQNEFTIELLFFDGEEAVVEWGRNNDNTYGSRYYVDDARRAGILSGLRALVLLDMIGDDLVIRREARSTPWLVDIVWSAAARLGHDRCSRTRNGGRR